MVNRNQIAASSYLKQGYEEDEVILVLQSEMKPWKAASSKMDINTEVQQNEGSLAPQIYSDT